MTKTKKDAFRVVLNLENCAFDVSPEVEVARILKTLADRIEALGLTDRSGGGLRDINGNVVGAWANYTKESTP